MIAFDAVWDAVLRWKYPEMSPIFRELIIWDWFSLLDDTTRSPISTLYALLRSDLAQNSYVSRPSLQSLRSRHSTQYSPSLTSLTVALTTPANRYALCSSACSSSFAAFAASFSSHPSSFAPAALLPLTIAVPLIASGSACVFLSTHQEP